MSFRCPTCGREACDLYLGWATTGNEDVVPGSPAIYHTGVDWCGNEWVARLNVPDAVPCDTPIHDDPEPMVDLVVSTFHRVGARDAIQLERLGHRIVKLREVLAQHTGE